MILRKEREADSPGRQAAVYGIFVLLVVTYTWPLMANPGAHLRQWFDVHYFVWELGWAARRAFEAPRSLFSANIFYPYGLSLAYSEPMLVPAVTTFAPVYAISGNPSLAYNVTVVLFQALAGWAGYYAARQLTRSTAAGWVGGIAFALSPIRSGYYHFAHMQLSFAVPLAFLMWARFLERRRGRDLAWALFFLWCQMVTVMYFGIPLILLLALLMVGVLLLRPRAWGRRALVTLVAGGIVFALAYLPVAWPYVMVRSEMGFERNLAEAGARPADLLTYVDAGLENRLYRLANSGTHPAMFPGFCVYALVGAALALAPRRARPPLPRGGVWARRLVETGLVLTLAVIAVFLATGGGTAHILGVRLRMTELGRAVGLLLGLGAAWLALEGWAWRRAGDEQALGPREWVPLLGLLAVVFILLSLGPVMHLGGRTSASASRVGLRSLPADPRAARHAPDRLHRHVPARPPRGLRPGRRPGPAVGRPIPPRDDDRPAAPPRRVPAPRVHVRRDPVGRAAAGLPVARPAARRLRDRRVAGGARVPRRHLWHVVPAPR